MLSAFLYVVSSTLGKRTFRKCDQKEDCIEIWVNPRPENVLKLQTAHKTAFQRYQTCKPRLKSHLSVPETTTRKKLHPPVAYWYQNLDRKYLNGFHPPFMGPNLPKFFSAISCRSVSFSGIISLIFLEFLVSFGIWKFFKFASLYLGLFWGDKNAWNPIFANNFYILKAVFFGYRGNYFRNLYYFWFLDLLWGLKHAKISMKFQFVQLLAFSGRSFVLPRAMVVIIYNSMISIEVFLRGILKLNWSHFHFWVIFEGTKML